MNPRRLLPLLGLFLLLAGAYYVLDWYQAKKSRDQEEANKVFRLKEEEISQILLKREGQEIRLVKEGGDWHLTQPLTERADGVTLSSLLSTLAHLRPDRDLGEQQDLKTFGLEAPSLVLSFKAGEQSHTLALGRKTPGEQGYYARRDEDRRVLVISSSSKESLDRPLSALRDRSVFDFFPDKVKSFKVKRGDILWDLEKTDKGWRWKGRESVKIHAERVERLLRYLSLARVKEFAADSPKDLRPYGLAPPALELTVVTEKGEQALFLGARKKEECYARRGAKGPVFLVEDLLLDFFTSPLESVAGLKSNPQWAHLRGTFPQYLEDRRLWPGEVAKVACFTWGPPGKTWTASKDKDFYQLSGPEQKQLRQPAVRVELALLKLRDLEGEHLGPAASPLPAATYVVDLKDAEGKLLFRLEETGQKTGQSGQVEVNFTLGEEAPKRAVISQEAYRQWQKDLEQLTSPPPS
uniref:DUF4340 domain-containing protein n=1 Tax=Desulfobacca acetoxidans TaxID=60893 RepID=A0A7C5ALU0_9BACT